MHPKSRLFQRKVVEKRPAVINKRTLTFEQCEQRLLLATFIFEDPIAIDGDLQRVTGIRAADFDGDGDNDIVAADTNTNSLLYYENVFFGARFGDRKKLAELESIDRLEVGDLDLDGDLDIVTASRATGTVYWGENDGHGEFALRALNTGQRTSRYGVVDWDTDGDLDILISVERHGFQWLRNDAGEFELLELVRLSSNAHNFDVGDLNNDGLMDIVHDSSPDGILLQSEGMSFDHYPAPGGGFKPISIFDFDLDGRLDIIRAERQSEVVSVYSSSNDDLNFERVAQGNDIAQHGIQFVDFDLDGVFEILGHEFTQPGPLRYSDTSDQTTRWGDKFLPTQYPFGDEVQVLGAYAATVDDDEAPDYIGFDANRNQLFWSRTRIFSDDIIAGSFARNDIYNLAAADINLDGLPDVVSMTDSEIAWYENLGRFRLGPPQTIINHRSKTGQFQVVDIDSDTDSDIITDSIWIENKSRGVEWGEHLIEGLDGPFHVVDWEADGIADIVSMPNLYSFNHRTQQIELTQASPLSSGVAAIADMDSDGDDDVLMSNGNWIENIPNARWGEVEHPVPGLREPAIAAFDLDSDGKMEFLLRDCGENFRCRDGWYFHDENDNLVLHRRSIRNRFSSNHIKYADMDADGDLDFVHGRDWLIKLNSGMDIVGSHFEELDAVIAIADFDADGDNDIVWADEIFLDQRYLGYQLKIRINDPDELPSLDDIDAGSINYNDLNAICEAIGDRGADQAFDVNQDSLVDHRDVEQIFFEVLEISYGDVNFDGHFDSQDLIELFQGDFYDNRLRKTRWQDGDWNCDGAFDSSDLILAFRDGQYLPE